VVLNPRQERTGAEVKCLSFLKKADWRISENVVVVKRRSALNEGIWLDICLNIEKQAQCAEMEESGMNENANLVMKRLKCDDWDLMFASSESWRRPDHPCIASNCIWWHAKCATVSIVIPSRTSRRSPFDSIGVGCIDFYSNVVLLVINHGDDSSRQHIDKDLE